MEHNLLNRAYIAHDKDVGRSSSFAFDATTLSLIPSPFLVLWRGNASPADAPPEVRV